MVRILDLGVVGPGSVPGQGELCGGGHVTISPAHVNPAFFLGSPLDGSAPNCIVKGVECQPYPGTIKISQIFRKE